MRILTYRQVLSAVIVPLFVPMEAIAQDFSSGRKVDNPEMARSAGDAAEPRATGRSTGVARSEESSRSLIEPGTSNFRMVKRSRDGTERTVEPSQRVLDAARRASSGGDRTRLIIGRDGRQHVQDTTQYPNVTVGLLQSTHEDPKLVFDCTATIIGPRIAITAANCVYDRRVEGGWLDKTNFWPALNGNDNEPFGAFAWEDMYVMDEFITSYKDSYDDVWPYDMAIIVFEKPIGEQIGWMGYNPLPDLTGFKATLVGYGEGTEPWQQFKSVCSLSPDGVSELDFLHQCDADDMSMGAPIYNHDAEADTYDVIALNMGALGKQNWALRIIEPIALWIDDMNEE